MYEYVFVCACHVFLLLLLCVAILLLLLQQLLLHAADVCHRVPDDQNSCCGLLHLVQCFLHSNITCF